MPSVRWPLLLLLASIGLTTLGVVEANRAIRSQRKMAQGALHDYAGFVAWSYGQHLHDVFLYATQEALGAVNHGGEMHSDPRIPPVKRLPEYLPWDPGCYCHRPRHGPTPSIYFAYVLGSDSLGYVANTHPDAAEGWEVDRPMPTPVAVGRITGYDSEERRWINDTLTKQIRHGYENGRFPMVVTSHNGVPRLLVYTLMPTSWGDTLVYGAEYAHSILKGAFEGVLNDRNLLPRAFMRGHAIRDVVQLRITDARNDVVFESEPVKAWALDDTMRLAPSFGSFLVRAQINPASGGSLIIGGMPASRLPYLLGLLALAAALSVVAVGQIRREGELARLRSDFVASISHELRTPLAQMRLYLETLRLGRFKTEDQRNWSLDNVERETTRLTQLVERVLRFSRTGRPDDETRESVDAASEARRIVDEFQPLAAARGSRVSVDVEAVPPLMLRPAALRHILLNLLDNAVKYGPADQVVQVRVRRAEGAVRIEVVDEGPGVAARDRDSVWRPYSRGKTAGHTAGSGLGLSIVRDVAQLHGGSARLEESAKGAMFTILLPA
ncbi:MAG: HAMP domain-containing sensor histidine kinase [Gemmatimonadaceae bacterium]